MVPLGTRVPASTPASMVPVPPPVPESTPVPPPVPESTAPPTHANVLLLQVPLVDTQLEQLTPWLPHSVSETDSRAMQVFAEQQPPQLLGPQVELPHDGATAMAKPIATPTMRNFEFMSGLKPEPPSRVKHSTCV